MRRAIEPSVLERRGERRRNGVVEAPLVEHGASDACACERSRGQRRQPRVPRPSACPAKERAVRSRAWIRSSAPRWKPTRTRTTAFVERAFREVLRRSPDDDARDRALAKLARRDAVARDVPPRARHVGRGDARARARRRRRARARRARPRASGSRGSRRRRRPTSASSRSRGSSRASSRRAACSRSATRSRSRRTSLACCAPGVELVGVDLAERDVDGMERLVADVRALPLPDASVDQVLLVSTLEHVGADNTGYGLDAEGDPGSRVDALRELGRVLGRERPAARDRPARRAGRPRLVPARRRRRLERALRVGWAVRRGAGGVRARRGGLAGGAGIPASGVGYGDRGPAASAVLCSELSVGRLRRLATPDGLAHGRCGRRSTARCAASLA